MSEYPDRIGIIGQMSEILFHDLPPGGTWKTLAYPMPPGSGPDGETCGTCEHSQRHSYHDKKYWKCALMPISHGEGTDIRKGSPACQKWEQAE